MSRSFLDMAHEVKHRNPTTELEKLLREYAWADSNHVLDLVLDNWPVLHKAGLLEEGFVEAWGTQKWGCPNWTPAFCRTIFAKFDRGTMLRAGDPLPPGVSSLEAITPRNTPRALHTAAAHTPVAGHRF